MSQGKLCGKCSIAFNSAWRDAEARLTQPLKRIGPKVAGQFARLVHRRIQPNALTIARQGRSVTPRPLKVFGRLPEKLTSGEPEIARFDMPMFAHKARRLVTGAAPTGVWWCFPSWPRRRSRLRRRVGRLDGLNDREVAQCL